MINRSTVENPANGATTSKQRACASRLRGQALLEQVQKDFIGLDTEYQLASGVRTRRRFLDSAASTLMMRAAYRTSSTYLKHYSNTHSFTHFSARISTELYDWAHRRMLDFFQADEEHYTCVFAGTGFDCRLQPDRTHLS